VALAEYSLASAVAGSAGARHCCKTENQDTASQTLGWSLVALLSSLCWTSRARMVVSIDQDDRVRLRKGAFSQTC